MSVAVMTWVFKKSESKGNDRLVMLAIADQADDEGYVRHGKPLSYNELARKTRCVRETAMRAVNDLELSGELIVDRENGPVVDGNRVNGYQVVMDLAEQAEAAARAAERRAEDPRTTTREAARTGAARRRREREGGSRDSGSTPEQTTGDNLPPPSDPANPPVATTPGRDLDTTGGRDSGATPGRDPATTLRTTSETRRETSGTTSAPTPDGADAPKLVDLDEPTRPEIVEESGRRRDLLFEALCEACRIDPAELTSSYRGAVNKALKDLREVGATPDEIHRRARAFRVRWPKVTLTPPSLAKHWATCAPESTVEHMTESTPDGTSARIARIAAEREARREREERAS